MAHLEPSPAEHGALGRLVPVQTLGFFVGWKLVSDVKTVNKYYLATDPHGVSFQ